MTYLPIHSGEAQVTTAEASNSTSFGDLATVGPSVTLSAPNSGVVFVGIAAQLSNGTQSAFAIASFATTDGTIAASDTEAISSEEPVVNERLQFGAVYRVSGLTPGTSYTFRMKYRVTAGTGTFGQRVLSVWTA